jgi:exodeoxyribonuclease VII large subunit
MEQNNFTNNVLTVKQLTLRMKVVLEETFPYVWVKGEIGSIKLHTSGHTYFSLKDEDCVINGVCWKGTPISTPLQEGVVVECYGKITIYGGRSSYQIVAREIRQVNEQGNIFQMLEELKKKLLSEGIFDSNRKRALNKYPSKIAIITSPTGAVLHDIMHRINERFPCVEVLFFPVVVQGSDAVGSIISAFDKLEKMENIDTVILARGGGSAEDLWCFNDETIVRRVASCKFPIISAIGHETDTTLVDYASDLRAPTPTGAAELATPDANELRSTIDYWNKGTLKSSLDRINFARKSIGNFEDYLYIYTNAFGSLGQRLDNILSNAWGKIGKKITEAKIALGILESPIHFISNFGIKIDAMYKMAMQSAGFKIAQSRNLINQIETFIKEKDETLNKQVFISLGSKRITSAADLTKGDELAVRFLDGSINAIVK